MSYASMKASQLEKKADTGLRSMLAFGKQKEKDAAKNYMEAGDLYQEDENFEQAAACYMKAAGCFSKLGQQMDLSNAYGDAGDCYQKCRKHQDAADVYEKSARILAENGKFVKAAETLIELVNVLEKDTKLKQALVHLEKAASYFEGENKDNTAKQLRERMALMNASAEYYDDAIEYWEERAETIINATNGMESKLKAKEYLFKAGLCQLAQVKDIEEDLEMAKDKIEEYREMDRWLVKAAEGQFLLEAVNAFEQKSIPMYQQAMRKYDDKNSVDLWTTNILDTIFSNFKSALDEEFDLT